MPCRHGSFPQNCRFGAMLAIASFIIHYLGWQARNRFLGRLSDGDNFAQVNFSLNGIPTSLGVYEDSTHLLSLAKSR
jgi:hypothetical protein